MINGGLLSISLVFSPSCLLGIMEVPINNQHFYYLDADIHVLVNNNMLTQQAVVVTESLIKSVWLGVKFLQLN